MYIVFFVFFGDIVDSRVIQYEKMVGYGVKGVGSTGYHL